MRLLKGMDKVGFKCGFECLIDVLELQAACSNRLWVALQPLTRKESFHSHARSDKINVSICSPACMPGLSVRWNSY